MTVDHEDDLAGLQLAGRAVAEARDAMLAAAAPGVTTAHLDAVGREVLDRHGARPAPPTVGFPAATCVSVNDEAAHGIPSPDRRAARGRPRQRRRVGRARRLLGRHRRQHRRRARLARPPAACSTPPASPTATPSPPPAPASRCATSAGPCSAGPGATGSRSSRTSRATAPAATCGSVRACPASRTAPTRTVLWEGLVLAIEPFLSTGATWADEAADGWTLVTPGHLRRSSSTPSSSPTAPRSSSRRLTPECSVLRDRPDRGRSRRTEAWVLSRGGAS